MISRSGAVRAATDITPIGIVGDERGRPLNLSQFGLAAGPLPESRPRTITVVGTSMNSGKTTTIHYLAHALAKAGLRPGVAKVTGTGSGGDYWVMLDAGAHRMLDFTDAGLASTYRQPMPIIEQATVGLVGELTRSGCGVNLIEVADGIFQQETARLIESPLFHSLVDGVIFAAGDAMGAYAGVQRLRELGHNVLAVSGLLSRSPLAAREAHEATGLSVLGIPELSDPQLAMSLLGVELAGQPHVDAEEPAGTWTSPLLDDAPDSMAAVFAASRKSTNAELAAATADHAASTSTPTETLVRTIDLVKVSVPEQL
jgi:hypothetical protein